MNFISHIVGDSDFVRVKGLGFENLHLKLESCNPAGSIKMKTAIGLQRWWTKEAIGAPPSPTGTRTLRLCSSPSKARAPPKSGRSCS